MMGDENEDEHDGQDQGVVKKGEEEGEGEVVVAEGKDRIAHSDAIDESRNSSYRISSLCKDVQLRINI